MMRDQPVVIHGAKGVIRNAEWVVRRIDQMSTGRQAIDVGGLSELVRNKEAAFLSEI